MDTEHQHEHDDIEAGKRNARYSNVLAMVEAGSLLALWSLLVINEGAIRVMDQNPSQDLLAAGRPSRFLLFLGGLFEVFFGLFGFFVGTAAFLLRRHSTLVTKACMAVQTLLGYYVFVFFVFVQPIFRAIDVDAGQPIGLSIGETRFVIAMGIMTSFHFCLALQGGQFVFMARLVCAATGENFLAQKSGNRMRAIFWNGNLALSGLWTLLTGAVVNANTSGGRLSGPPIFSPPNVGLLPGMTIFTGLVLFVWGIAGIVMALMGVAPMAFFMGSAVVYVLGLLNFGIVQFGLLDGPPGGAVALHNGLVFMVVFIGAYFVHTAANESKQEPVEASSE